MAIGLLPASSVAMTPKVYTDAIGRQYTIDSRNGKKKYLSSGTTSLPAPDYGNVPAAVAPSSGFSMPRWVWLVGGAAALYFVFLRRK